MNAIGIYSLRSPFDRFIFPSIALRSPLSSPFVRLRSAFDRPSHTPPIPPEAFEARLGGGFDAWNRSG